ncbi:MAG: hypothetical protein SFY68_14620 [Candidatus Sumerlaeia bacterium]|nr:hypothetical protein [Candidatus Sumerlaeia bacterium]
MPISLEELQRALDPETVETLTNDSAYGVSQSAIIQQASDAAESELHERLNISTPTLELELFYRDIWLTWTVERLFERRREALPLVWRERADRARAYVAEIASRKTLPIPSGSTLRPAANRDEDDRLHSPETLHRF